MNAQHTLGPWVAKTYNTETVRDAVGIYAGTLQVVPDIAGRSLEQCDANIRLIASAPDLFAALREIVAAVEVGDVDGFSPSGDWFREAKAALNKVEGI